MQFNDAFFDELGTSPGVTALVVDVADGVAETARSTAPEKTGEYKAGIKVILKHQRRSVALVVGTDPKTMIIESKTGNLARALRAAKKRG